MLKIKTIPFFVLDLITILVTITCILFASFVLLMEGIIMSVGFNLF